jgi:hypothetical protein
MQSLLGYNGAGAPSASRALAGDQKGAREEHFDVCAGIEVPMRSACTAGKPAKESPAVVKPLTYGASAPS